jgi:hypothetical protein
MNAVVHVSLTATLLATMSISNAIHAETAYFVGNSLTQATKPEGLSLMASASNIPMTNGMHSAWGKDLALHLEQSR